MDFREFLQVAESLSLGDSEGDWRSACSRAYYAAFHVAGDFLRDLGFHVPRMERAHAFSWLRLSNAEVEEVIEFGKSLNSLRSDRNRADYEGHISFTQAKAVDWVQIARRMIAALDDALEEPTRSQVQEAIKKYERDILKEVSWQPS